MMIQDAMQRGALVPYARWASEKKQQSKQQPDKVLEVACGTGRFATFVRDAHPEIDMTVSDLSPFYLEAARENQVSCFMQFFCHKDCCVCFLNDTSIRFHGVLVLSTTMRTPFFVYHFSKCVCVLSLISFSIFWVQNYWERARGRDKTSKLGSVNYVQAAAEELPFADATYDGTCIFNFHK